jgi:CMP-N,N'-diacetyllegionaminic acid synthase
MADEAWIVIPARKGKGKNTWLLNGIPMIEYCMAASCLAEIPFMIVCSTDDEDIMRIADRYGIRSIFRRPEYAGDDASITETVLKDVFTVVGTPHTVVLVQPTSPFVRPGDIDMVASSLGGFSNSAMTAIKVPHNYHALNQRGWIPDPEDWYLDFIYAQEHKAADMKQKKDEHLAFGNVVAAKSSYLVGGTFFPNPCTGIVIPRPNGFDVDTVEDIVWAEALLNHGVVKFLGGPQA